MQLETSVIIPLFLAASLAVLPAAAAPQSLNNSNARQEKQKALSPAESCPGPFKTLAEKHLCLKLAEACPGPYKTTAEMYSCEIKLPQDLFNGTMRKAAEESIKHEEHDMLAKACPGPYETPALMHSCRKLAKACPGPYKTTAEMYSCQSKLPQELFNETMRKNAEESVKHEEADKEKRYMMYLTSAGKACEDQHPNNITAIMECLQGRPVLSPFQEG